MLLLAVALQRAFYGRPPLAGLWKLGFVAPTRGSLLVALILVAAMLAFFPVFAALTGARVSLKPDWWWLLAGAIALNGIAEETLFRGYVFGGLRHAGFGFAAAGTVSLAIFAAVHLFLFIGNPPLVAILGVAVAVTTAFPLAFLYERGGNAIWAPAIVHVGTHAIRFVDVAEPHPATAITAWLVLQLVVPFGVFLFARSRLL